MIKSTLFPTGCLKHLESHGTVFKHSVFSQKSSFPFKWPASRTCFMKRNQRKRKIYANISISFSLKIFASRSLPISKASYSTSRNLTHSFWALDNIHFPNKLENINKMTFTEGHRSINPTEVSPLNKYETGFPWVKVPGNEASSLGTCSELRNSELAQDRKRHFSPFCRNYCQKALRGIISE